MAKKKKTLKEIQKELSETKYKKRDVNIEKHLKGEISLSTRKVKSKKVYSRKKSKKIDFDDLLKNYLFI